MSDVQTLGLSDLPAQDFVHSAGFAGLAVLAAAVIALCAVMYASRQAGKRSLAERDQSARHHEEMRADDQRADDLSRCWGQFWQLLETAAVEPSDSEGATLGLGPEVTLALLRGLLRDAEKLDDDTLAKAVALHQEQLVLVLAQQSGPISRLGADRAATPNNSKPPGKQTSATKGAAAAGPASEPKHRPTASPPTSKAAAGTTPTAAKEDTTDRRR